MGSCDADGILHQDPRNRCFCSGCVTKRRREEGGGLFLAPSSFVPGCCVPSLPPGRSGGEREKASL